MDTVVPDVYRGAHITTPSPIHPRAMVASYAARFAVIR
jgi:hypothetical protein